MSNGFWLSLAILALGTFLLRALPQAWMQRYLHSTDDEKAAATKYSATQGSPAHRTTPEWLGVLATTLIAAMLGAFLVPADLTPSGWMASLTGTLATLLTWWFTRSLGWPVVVGVTGFALSRLLI